MTTIIGNLGHHRIKVSFLRSVFGDKEMISWGNGGSRFEGGEGFIHG